MKAQIQTPKCIVPFGTSNHFDDSQQHVALSLDNDRFLRCIKEIDDAVINLAYNQRHNVFGEKSQDWSRHQIEARHCSLLKSDRSGRFSPLLRIKINADTKVGDSNKNMVDANHITKGCLCICLIELGPIWQVNQSFGLSLRAKEIQVLQRPEDKKLFDWIIE